MLVRFKPVFFKKKLRKYCENLVAISGKFKKLEAHSPCPETRAIASARVRKQTTSPAPVPTSLSTVRSHMPNRNFVVTTATLVTQFFCHNSALLSFILNETFYMLQQEGALYFVYVRIHES